MTKEEKLVVINAIAEQLQAYPHFYIADIEALNAEQTAALRRKCYESDIKLVVVKNTLLAKALEKVEKADAELVKVLEGPTSIMFANVAKAPAVLIKEFRKDVYKRQGSGRTKASEGIRCNAGSVRSGQIIWEVTRVAKWGRL